MSKSNSSSSFLKGTVDISLEFTKRCDGGLLLERSASLCCLFFF